MKTIGSFYFPGLPPWRTPNAMATSAMTSTNPVGIRGLAFLEFCGDAKALSELLTNLGFRRSRQHPSKAVSVYTQGEATMVVNDQPGSFAAKFRDAHGPCASAIGLLVEDARKAFDVAVQRGARPYTGSDALTLDTPAVYGIGQNLIYFVDGSSRRGDQVDRAFPEVASDAPQSDAGLLTIDHLTNNVEKGQLDATAKFYEDVFGFRQLRSFDIVGTKTGLYSFALRSPCGTFCIPINEDKGNKGQIAEYLQEYRGPGIQHIALLSRDLLGTLDRIKGRVPTLDIDDEYYQDVFTRVHGVREAPERIRAHQVLVDGDEEGYLLQIFSKNCIGPIFFELIQRENHHSFGEGNFGALFRSIERDQERRGVL